MMELFMQYLKYLLEGLAVAAAAYYIPQKKTSLREVAMIALTAAATFAVLDIFAPAIASGARQGAGFGIGANHVGFGEGFYNEEEDDDEVEEPAVEGFGSCGSHKKEEGFYGGCGSHKKEEGFYGGCSGKREEEGFYNEDEEEEDTDEGFYVDHEEDKEEGFANTVDSFDDEEDEDEDDTEDFGVEGFNI